MGNLTKDDVVLRSRELLLAGSCSIILYIHQNLFEILRKEIIALDRTAPRPRRPGLGQERI